MEQKAEPVACPFCGNDGKGPIALAACIDGHDWRDASWSVQCDKCTATMGYSDSEDEAIAAWNQRANPQPAAVDGVVKLAFLYAYAAGFKTCEETSRSCIGSVDEAWEEYQALAQIERKPEDGK